MKDFTSIRKRCEEVSQISSIVIDEFLLHYAAAKDNLSREFDLRIAPYRHLTQTETKWVNMLKSQYIIHRVFKAGGLLKKYLNHAEIKLRRPDELEFLSEQLLVPWRFSFSRIIGNPAPDFYEMQDVFSDASFVLYSKGTSQTLKEQPVMLWFNLIAFNGSCWQTFGPLHAYRSFDADDIFFFATELNHQIDDEGSLMADVEKNPIPYMMLDNGGGIPMTVSKNDELLILFSEDELNSIDSEKLKKHLKVEYNSNVYRITISKFDEPPHLAAAYFDETDNRVVVTAMTERGFNSLVSALNKSDFNIDEEPQIRIRPSMLVTAERVLKKKLLLNPYEKLFAHESTPEERIQLDRMNEFLQLVLPAINAGRVPDVEAFAKKAGIDGALAKRLVKNTVTKIEAMKRKSGK